MAEYHVGCGLAGIYAGTLKDNWKSKTDVTNEAVSAVAQYLLENGKTFSFSYQGKRYIMKVENLVVAE